MRASDDVLRGEGRVAPVTRACWEAEYLSHNIVIA
jgi:hypothetical protein